MGLRRPGAALSRRVQRPPATKQTADAVGARGHAGAGVAGSAPDNCTLLGVSVYAQGMLYDPTGSMGIALAFGGALELVIGP